MSRRHLIRRIRARLDGERGAILETVIALMVVFASLTALAYTASIGFRYVGYGRDRIQATGIANRDGGHPRSRLHEDHERHPRFGARATTAGSSTAPASTGSSPVRGEKIVSSTFAGGYSARGSCRIGPR